MYLDFYQLREYPFTLACDPRFLYFSSGHKEAMAGMLYCLRERKGAALLLGEPGTGKTTLLAAVQQMLPGGVVAQTLDTPLHATAVELLGAVVRGYGLDPAAGGMSELLARLQEYLRERHDAGECVLLLVDEAQDLNPIALEQVRLLTNFEAGGHKLLQIILSGQPELATHLRTVNGRALHQRIAVRCHLQPLTLAETDAYLQARLEQAGADRRVFDAAAVQRIHELTLGVPRVINVIADHCLLAGFTAQARTVGRGLVEKVGVQLQISPLRTAPAAVGPQAAAPAAADAAANARPPALQRFASGWARWAGLTEGK